MRLILNVKKSVEKNAADYFEKAKKAKNKIEGLKAALKRFEQQKEKLLKEKESVIARLEKPTTAKPTREKAWYEKFRWFYSSEGFLCIGGRDATTNDIIIKKHTQPGDLVFHTEAPGSPFFVIKAEGKTIGEATKEETAQATASYSRGWKLGVSSMEVYHVTPEQVTKQAKAGEYLAKGAFMIIGKRTYYHPNLEVAVGILDDGRIMGGPLPAVRKHCKKYAIIRQGDEKPSDIAKHLIKLLGGGTPDEFIAVLPSGEMRVARQ
ncbi:MAG: NFACT RNA binding domain-containing protein [Candidatus Woesearchaeota archaeon]